MTTISDEAVSAATGKDWDEWFQVLDEADAEEMSHKEIAQWVDSHYPIGGWWAQTVTVQYERARGRRQMHEKPAGFEISASKTIAQPVKALYKAWEDPKLREQWLSEGIEIHKATPLRSLRITWLDGQKSVNVNFYEKDEKTQVVIQHGKLASAEQAEGMKVFWKSALSRLAEVQMHGTR